MHSRIEIGPLLLASAIYLALFLLIAGVLVLFLRRTRHVKWILPTLAGALGSLLIGVSAPWPNVKVWHVVVLLALLM